MQIGEIYCGWPGSGCSGLVACNQVYLIAETEEIGVTNNSLCCLKTIIGCVVEKKGSGHRSRAWNLRGWRMFEAEHHSLPTKR